MKDNLYKRRTACDVHSVSPSSCDESDAISVTSFVDVSASATSLVSSSSESADSIDGLAGESWSSIKYVSY